MNYYAGNDKKEVKAVIIFQTNLMLALEPAPKCKINKYAEAHSLQNNSLIATPKSC